MDQTKPLFRIDYRRSKCIPAWAGRPASARMNVPPRITGTRASPETVLSPPPLWGRSPKSEASRRVGGLLCYMRYPPPAERRLCETRFDDLPHKGEVVGAWLNDIASLAVSSFLPGSSRDPSFSSLAAALRGVGDPRGRCRLLFPRLHGADRPGG